jgi:exoribonuclease II
MYAFIDEDSTHKAATILSQADNSAQVELVTGKRIKIKLNQILFTFASPAPQALMAQAVAEAAQIDPDFLWELLPQSELLAVDFAPDYFGGTKTSVTAVQKAALLIALHAQPAIFNRKGKGLYKPATPEMLAVVKESLAKKAREQARCDAMVAELVAGQLPPEVQAACPNIAFKPDKNGWAWKALALAAKQVGTHPTRLLMQRGAFKSHYALHMARFMAEQFPQGAAHRAIDLPPFIAADLPLASVQAFSIDDSQTTEIDDALSVTHLADGNTEVGIHIAAPSLVMPRSSALDKLAKSRMSTVYMPGNKITMLPDAAVAAFSLDEGRPCPAVSLYCTYNPQFECVATRTVTERVPLAANLRHDVLEEFITTEDVIAGTLPANIPFGKALSYLYALRGVLSVQRDAVRGKPENNNRTDFNFAVAWADESRSDAENATVTITTRKRGSPLDAIVSEMMILANSSWAGLLGKLGVPGVFRGQRFGKVKMSTTPMPHESIGVAQYGWFTSPLRRYSDLVNQAQLLACVQFGATAALAAPYKPKDVDLYSIVGAFDEQYSAYSTHQSNMERYWCLRWLNQHTASQGNTQRMDAVVVRPDTVRLRHLPLYIEVAGLPEGARGRPVVVDVIGWDELDLSVQARFAGEGNADGGAVAAFEALADDEAQLPLSVAVLLPDADDDADSDKDKDKDKDADSDKDADANNKAPNTAPPTPAQTVASKPA